MRVREREREREREGEIVVQQLWELNLTLSRTDALLSHGRCYPLASSVSSVTFSVSLKFSQSIETWELKVLKARI